MGKKKKKKQKEVAKEEKEVEVAEAEEEEDAEFNQMLAEFKQDDVEQGRHAESLPPAAAVHMPIHTHARSQGSCQMFRHLTVIAQAFYLVVITQAPRASGSSRRGRRMDPALLLEAARTGDLERVKQLARDGAPVNWADVKGFAALHFAACICSVPGQGL